jgi:hypothetical protein
MRSKMAFLVAAAALLTPTATWACGGFFCDSVTMEPVDQAGERILFQVHGDGSITTYVEITYQGQPERFGWILPTPEPIEVDNIDIIDSELFNELEAMTAPRFSFIQEPFDPCTSGCGGGGVGCASAAVFADGGETGEDLTPGVEVVGTLEIGPFNIEVIEANDAVAFNDWLASNDYLSAELSNAIQPVEHYIDEGMAFLGVKLIPERVEGPIDTLVIHYESDDPMIPLILTGIAAVADMPIVVYVLADGPYRPTNYAEVNFDLSAVEPDFTTGGSTYVPRLQEALAAAGHHAFVTELSTPTDRIVDGADLSADLLEGGAYLTRFRTYLSPEQMTLDPVFGPDPDAPDVTNVHVIEIPAPDDPCGNNRGAGVATAFLPLVALFVRRFRATEV